MVDTLMVPGSGSGLLINEAGVLAVGQNCCECNSACSYPSFNRYPPDHASSDWPSTLNFEITNVSCALCEEGCPTTGSGTLTYDGLRTPKGFYYDVDTTYPGLETGYSLGIAIVRVSETLPECSYISMINGSFTSEYTLNMGTLYDRHYTFFDIYYEASLIVATIGGTSITAYTYPTSVNPFDVTMTLYFFKREAVAPAESPLNYEMCGLTSCVFTEDYTVCDEADPPLSEPDLEACYEEQYAAAVAAYDACLEPIGSLDVHIWE